MLSKLTKRQLVAFAVVTFATTLIMGLSYIQVPALLGIGRFEVTVTLPATGGLYQKSVVTYRGSEVGTVSGLRLVDDGVQATLSIDDSARIPRDTQVQVRSASAIGEQYIDFVPRSGGGARLEDGDRLVAGPDALPVTTAELLGSVETFFKAVPREALNTTIEELDAAFTGTDKDLARLIDQGSAFQEKADANLDPTVDLIRSLDPVLKTQQDVAPDLRAWTRDLDKLTETLAASDGAIRNILTDGPPLAREIVDLVGRLNEPLPRLLTDLSLAGEVLEVYVPNIEHVLTVLPAAVEMHFSSLPADRLKRAYPEANLSFKLSANNPPACTQGFRDAGKHRSPKDLSPAPVPTDSYCKVPSDDVRVVRGARNQACPNGRRGATAAQCGYVFQPEVVAAQQGGEVATYDPTTGRGATAGGELFRLGEPVLGKQSWQDFLLGMVR